MATRDFVALQQRIMRTRTWQVRFIAATSIQPDPTQRFERVEAGAVRRLPQPLARELVRQGFAQVLKES